MGKIYEAITELIGHTPLLRLNGYIKKNGLDADILGKIEFFNPNQSIKDRIALSMIEEAEKNGSLKKGGTILEATSGNTGIGLSAIAAVKGYKTHIYVQDTVSEERFKVMRAFGTEVSNMSDIPEVDKALKENNNDYVAGYAAFYEKFLGKDDSVFLVNQDANPANPEIHYKTTGPEIWEDSEGTVDIVVAAVGTGGTVTGVGKYLKEKRPDIKVIAVQPGENSIPSKDNPNPEEIAGVHPFVGIPAEFVPSNLDDRYYDECFPVETSQAYEAAREVARTDGILIGASSGAILYAATQVAKREENKDKTIVAIFPDTGLRYLSTNLFG
ncbi:PLP-dependent cysteine synthase family protein [Butyrivibrio hungatei]|uniref:PLP-dependent cysteine synthase family protein n=1 Tax=Butyrivibrio hungatei TaxID=185008 RepID=UPI0003F510F1|nr:PLP-dependent cysteine synthase family protein [Butyrivibrio hungatei]